MTSDHLDVTFVWKSLVASCVRVWLKFERTFSACSSPARNTFVSGPAQNAFVASDKRVCLQCDIVFGSE